MLKKVLPVLVVLFLGFWLFTDPHGLARATRSSASEAGEPSPPTATGSWSPTCGSSG